ncbi:MAG: AAA family ATPase [Myxococcota bacterium]|jgi:ATP-dependent Clp protease ATP-binding subunit ClpA/protein subunit release factor A|nr:AAA family ATPase [Myxococcota bacterium]
MEQGGRDERGEIERCVALMAEAQGEDEFEAAAEMLLEFGTRGLSLLRRRVSSLSPVVQRGCVSLGQRVGGREGALLLAQLLADGGDELEGECIVALGASESEHALRPLLHWLVSSANEDQLELLTSSVRTLVAQLERRTLSETLAGLDEKLLEQVWGVGDDWMRQLIARERERRRLLPFGRVLEEEGSLGRAYGRDEVKRAMLERLGESGSRSVLLVGPAGSGKSTVIHDLVRHLGPETGVDTLLQTSTGMLLAGTRYLGEWQTRARDLLELVAQQRRIAVYFTDVSNLVSAGASASSTDNLADVLAPAMARGDLAVIGEAAPETVQRVLESRPEFRRLFRTIVLDEPLPEKTRAIVEEVSRELSARASEQFGILLRYSETFVQRALELAGQFRSTVAQPGRSIDLLRSTAHRRLREASAGETVVMEAHDLVETLSMETGVPVTMLDDRSALELDAVCEFLSSRVMGQRRAITELVDLVTLIKAGLTDPTKPTGVLLFIGPTGVGKTELAKALAEFLFGSSERMIRLDMSEFNDALAVERLLGNPHAPEWSASRHGLLTGRIRHEPMSVLLLDEVEKAHRSVFDVMLQLMDDGRLTDISGNVVNFTQAIVIMTSNVGGEELFARNIGFRSDPSPLAEDAFRRELERAFRPEFINRIDRVIPFVPLDEEAMRQIARREVERLVGRSGFTRRRVCIDIDDSVIALLVRDGFDPRYGARPLKRLVERLVLLPLARALVELGPLAEQALLRVAVMPGASTPQVEVVQREHGPVSSQAAVSGPGPERGVERLHQSVEALRRELQSVESMPAVRGLLERKAALVQATGSGEFWDEALSARRTMTEIHWIERVLAGMQRLRKRVDDLTVLSEQQGARGDERHHRALARAEDIELELSHLRMAVSCNDDATRRDAFVVLTRLDNSPFSLDPVESLAAMYVSWGQRHQYRVQPVDEALDGSSLSTLTLVFEGLCPFGILRHEAGIHRFHADVESKRGHELRRVTTYVRVDVLPFVEPELLRLSKADYALSRVAVESTYKVMERVRQVVQLTHRDSDLRVRVASEKSQEEATELAEELLRARLARYRIGHGAPALSSTPVRSYRLGSRPSVRDELTGVRSARVEELLGGRLESFLEARVRREASAMGVG